MSTPDEPPRASDVETETAPETDARATEPVFEGVKFDVERRRVPTRDGGSAVRELVVHPGAVVVLPLLEDGRIVMIRNHRFAVDETLWELCAGTLEPGEDPARTAARELVEETGYEAAHIAPLTMFYTTPGICTERMYAFVATGLEEVGQQLEATEQIEVEVVSRDDVMAMAASGEIRDGKTLATLLFWGAFRAPE
ncbi:MAG: NUDIX hydrolase [Gemmatimonadota bacterium]|nr:NUDIX hydrolase [Gemmatimonadota bacterium]